MRILVAGAGETGLPIIHYFSERGHSIVVLERSPKRCKEVTDTCDATVFIGDAAKAVNWKTVEPTSVDAAIITARTDASSAKICRIAKKLGIPLVVARVNEQKNIKLLGEAGADIAICPSLETLRLFLNAVEHTTTETLYENIMLDLKIAFGALPSQSPLVGADLKKLNLPQGCSLAMVFRENQPVPLDDSFIFKSGDKALFYGKKELVEKMVEEIRKTEHV